MSFKVRATPHTQYCMVTCHRAALHVHCCRLGQHLYFCRSGWHFIDIAAGQGNTSYTLLQVRATLHTLCCMMHCYWTTDPVYAAIPHFKHILVDTQHSFLKQRSCKTAHPDCGWSGDGGAWWRRKNGHHLARLCHGFQQGALPMTSPQASLLQCLWTNPPLKW